MGEGSVSLHPANQGRTVSALLYLALRADDRPVLQDIYERLGGVLYITRDERNPNPTCRWNLSGVEDIEWVLSNIAVHTHIPFRKLQEVQVALDFIQWRRSIPYRLTPENRATAQSFVKRMRDIRVFKEQSGLVSVPVQSSGFPEGQPISSPG